MRNLAVFVAISSTWVTLPALAHQPIVSDRSANGPANAIALGDIGVSRIVYHEVTTEAPRLWLTFDATAGRQRYVQLGVREIDRLATYRPSVAVLGPGLPSIDLPFEIPVGFGELLFSSADVAESETFDEPFSGTSSWILFEQNVTLPEDGTYFVAAFDPAAQPGKLWVATGREERFELDETAQLSDVLRQVRAFHEESAGPACFLLPFAGFIGLLAVARLRPTWKAR